MSLPLSPDVFVMVPVVMEKYDEYLIDKIFITVKYMVAQIPLKIIIPLSWSILILLSLPLSEAVL